MMPLLLNAQQEMALSPPRVANHDLETWLQKTLTVEDAVVLEMTTNTYEFYDTLLSHVHSVTVVHPPHVALITRAQVKTDRKAALGLVQLHAAGLLVGIWIPPQAVRDLGRWWLSAKRWYACRRRLKIGYMRWCIASI